MPYTGKPSGACQPCKDRHTKCDGLKAACGRCVKANRVCTGYQEGLDLVLRNQNDVAKANVERRQRSRDRFRSISPRVSMSPVEDEESHAVTFFISSWVFFPHDARTDRGISELLPLFFGEMKSGTALSLALAATSRLLFGAWERRIRDIETPPVQTAYSKAIAATRKAIEDPIESLKDEAVMAVLLLGLYEAAAMAFRGTISPVRHFEGAAAVISKQEGHAVRSSVRNSLIKAVRSNLVFRSMQSSTPIDLKSSVWHDDSSMQHNPASLLDLHCTEVANLLALDSTLIVPYDAPRALKRTPTQKPNELYAQLKLQPDDDSSVWTSLLVSQAKAANSKLMSWLDSIPIDWYPISVPGDLVPPSVREAGMYEDYCDTYSDILVATTWNEWRSARIKVLALIGHYEPSEQVTANIQGLVDEICATVPLVLGDRKAMTIMWNDDSIHPCAPGRELPLGHSRNAAAFGGWYILTPLRETTKVARHLRSGQLDWIMGQMQRLAKIYDVVSESE